MLTQTNQTEVPMISSRSLLAATFAVLVTSIPGAPLAMAQGHDEHAMMMVSNNVSVVLTEYSITPSIVRVPANQTVTISTMNTGASNSGHQLSIAGLGEEWTTDLTRNGEAAQMTVTFAQPGVYWIWCPVGTHKDRGMTGAISVE